MDISKGIINFGSKFNSGGFSRVDSRMKEYLSENGEYFGRIRGMFSGGMGSVPLEVYKVNDHVSGDKIPIGIFYGSFTREVCGVSGSSICVSIPSTANKKLKSRIRRKIGIFASVNEDGTFTDDQMSEWTTPEYIERLEDTFGYKMELAKR